MGPRGSVHLYTHIQSSDRFIRKKDTAGKTNPTNTQLIGLSANNVDSHAGWIKDINSFSNGTELDFPIIADEDRTVSELYGMLDGLDKSNVDKKGMPFTVRTVFISEWPPGQRANRQSTQARLSV